MIKTLILKRSFDHPKSALVAGGHRFELYHPDHAEKSRKILYLKIEPRSSEINFEKVEVDANWDGLHGFFTHISEDHSAKIMQCYRGLWQIEEAFRVNKHSLKMRPIYHWSPRRIRSHISLCYLTYAVTKHSIHSCLLYTSPSPRDRQKSRMPSSA